MQLQQKSGQHLVEYAVVLALVTVVAVSIVAGIGHRSTNRFAQIEDGLAESTVAAATADKGQAGTSGITTGIITVITTGNDRRP